MSAREVSRACGVRLCRVRRVPGAHVGTVMLESPKMRAAVYEVDGLNNTLRKPARIVVDPTLAPYQIAPAIAPSDEDPAPRSLARYPSSARRVVETAWSGVVWSLGGEIIGRDGWTDRPLLGRVDGKLVAAISPLAKGGAS